MGEQFTPFENTKVSIRKEATEGTLIAEEAASAVLVRKEGFEPRIPRDVLEGGYMTGSFSKTAPEPGMYGDDLGFTLPVFARGKGTLTYPDWHVAMESLMGIEVAATAGTIKAATTPTTTSFEATDVPDAVKGQLIRVNNQITRITDITGSVITVWPPFSTAPDAGDAYATGHNWMLSSTSWPTFSAYVYFNSLQRLAFAGCRATSLTMTFEPGQRVPMDFNVVALSPTMDYTAQAVTPVYDTATVAPRCLGMTIKTTYAGVAKGVPTTTETVLNAPNFAVGIGDKIMLNTATGWETNAITNVVGNAGTDITLTHAAFSETAAADETVYIVREKCADLGDSVTITVEIDIEFIKCMANSSGKYASLPTGRSVTVERTPYFTSWKEFYMRDNVVSAELMIQVGSTEANIINVYILNLVISEASLTTDPLMKVDTTAMAVRDTVLGNDHELVIAAF